MFSRAYSNIKIYCYTFIIKLNCHILRRQLRFQEKKELLYLRTLTITWAQSPKSGSALSCLRECLAKWSQVRGKYTLETRNIRGVIPAAESQHNPVRWIQSRLGIWYHGAVPHIIYSFAIDTRKFLNNELKGRYSCGGNKSQSQEINKTKADVSSFWPHPLPDGYWDHGKKFIHRNNWFPLAGQISDFVTNKS